MFELAGRDIGIDGVPRLPASRQIRQVLLRSEQYPSEALIEPLGGAAGL